MAGIKISNLPPVPVAPALGDLLAEVQPALGGVTYKVTLQQINDLFALTSGGVNPGNINELAYYAVTGSTVSGLTTANNSALITSPTGVPSLSTVLPGGLTTTDPTLTQGIATKHYVDQTSLNGTSVYASTTTNLTVTQSGSGPGATLTNAGAQATFALDGVSPTLGSNVLVKNLAAPQNEGVYTVTNVGSGATNWVLTRAIGFDTPSEINNTGLIVIQNGSTLAGQTWYNTATVVTVDTTPLNFVRFGITDPINKIVIQKFVGAGSSTYTPTSGMKYCTVELLGSGGGGGGAQGGVGATAVGAGGGGGAYLRRTYTAVEIGATAAIVIGAIGTGGAAGNNPGTAAIVSTFTPAGSGNVLTCGGGAGGAGGISSVNNSISGIGGAGGSASATTYDYFNIGAPGGYGVGLGAAAQGFGGDGGSSGMGGGHGGGGTGITATGPGGGGAGAAAAAANVAGGNGSAGLCTILEYISV